MLCFAERGISTVRHGEREPDSSREDVLHLPHAASRRHPPTQAQRHKEVGGLLSFVVTRSTFVSHFLKQNKTESLLTFSVHFYMSCLQQQ